MSGIGNSSGRGVLAEPGLRQNEVLYLGGLCLAWQISDKAEKG